MASGSAVKSGGQKKSDWMQLWLVWLAHGPSRVDMTANEGAYDELRRSFRQRPRAGLNRIQRLASSQLNLPHSRVCESVWNLVVVTARWCRRWESWWQEKRA